MQASSTGASSSGASSSGASGVASREYSEHKRKFSRLLGGSTVNAPPMPDVQQESEWDRYMRTPAALADLDMDVFTWWKRREMELPNLLLMAQQFLSCPASSAGTMILHSC